MKVPRHLVTVACVAALLGCERPTAPVETEESSPAPNLSFSPGAHGSGGAAVGVGEFLLGGVAPFKFAVASVLTPHGRAFGWARHQGELNGFVYDFETDVTCMAVDKVNNRAWIAGVIKRNGTTDPAFQQAIHQPGRDIWFRLADGGRGPDADDRITFVGFTGTAGIQTSQEYCNLKIWPNNAQPVVKGSLLVH